MSRSGEVWVVSLISLPFIGWLVGSSVAVNWTDETWRCRCIVWIVLGLGVPVVCALVHTRRLSILTVTLLVGLTTLPAFRHLDSGPRVADTTIVDIDCQTHERRGMRCIEDRLKLGDGRSVRIDTSRVGKLRAGDRARVTTLDDVALRLDRL
jgi:hypothetical protein